MTVRRIAKLLSPIRRKMSEFLLLEFSPESQMVSWLIQNQTVMCQMCMAAVVPSVTCFCAIWHTLTFG